MPTMLHPNQRQILGRLSHFAFLKVRGDGATELDETEWRHAEVRHKTGRGGIRDCDQSHYAALKTHFLNLQGPRAIVPALRAAEREVMGNDYHQALHRLAQLLAHHGKRLDYARPLFRAMCGGVELEQASVAQVNKVFFAFQDRLERGGARRKKFLRQHPAPAPAAKPYFLKP